MKDAGVGGGGRSWILWFQQVTEFRLLVVGESLHEGSERSLHPSVKVKPPGLQWRSQDFRSARVHDASVKENCLQRVDPRLEQGIYFRQQSHRTEPSKPPILNVELQDLVFALLIFGLGFSPIFLNYTPSFPLVLSILIHYVLEVCKLPFAFPMHYS